MVSPIVPPTVDPYRLPLDNYSIAEGASRYDYTPGAYVKLPNLDSSPFAPEIRLGRVAAILPAPVTGRESVLVLPLLAMDRAGNWFADVHAPLEAHTPEALEHHPAPADPFAAVDLPAGFAEPEQD